jgi:hypothetical protein
VNEIKILQAIRELGGQATAEQVIAALGITDRRAEVPVLVAMGRLLGQGELSRGEYTASGRFYCIAGSANGETNADH